MKRVEERNMKNVRMIWTVVLAIIVAIAAGCQAIGGIDLSKVIYNSNIKSSEGKASVSFNLDFTAPTPANQEEREELAMWNLFKQTKITMDSIKVEDPYTMSVAGAVSIGKGKIGYRMFMDKEQLVVDLEGAGKPIVIRSLDLSSVLSEMEEETEQLNEDATDKLMNSVTEIQDLLLGYVAKQLPNPKTINISGATTTINKQPMNLTKIQAEMKGDELLDYALEFLNNIVDDKKGAESLIGELVDLIMPIVAAQMGQNEAEINEMLEEIKEVKAEIVNGYYEMILSARDELENSMEEDPELLKNEAGIDENSTLKVDLFVDKNLNTLKSKYDLYLTSAKTDGVLLEEEDDNGPQLKSVRIILEEEKWNLNGNVNADLIATDKSAIILDENMSTRRMVHSMNKGSLLYQVLRNDMHMTRQTVELPVQTRDRKPEQNMSAYIDRGVSMVPLRKVSDGFDATLNFNKQTKQVEFLDEGNRITVPLNSKVVHLNGKKKFIGMSTVNRNGVTYVPAREMLKLVGAKVTWNSANKEIKIERK